MRRKYFTRFRKLKRILEGRAKVFADDNGKVDWSLGGSAGVCIDFERRYAASADRTGFRTRHIRTPEPCPSR